MNRKSFKPKLNSIIFFAVIVLTMLLIYFVSTKSFSMEKTELRIGCENGIWDLRGVDFEKYYVNLGGPGHVAYIPNALLTPDEFRLHEDEAVYGPTDFEQYLTSRIIILLPDDGWYSFFRTSIDYSQRLYINGEWVLDIGVPGDSKKTSVPDTGIIAVTIKAENGAIEIVQQSSNFVHREGGGHKNWLMGVGDELTKYNRSRDITASFIGMGGLFMLFIIFLLLYFMLRINRAPLYFSLFCLMWFLRIGVGYNKLFTDLWPWLGWYAKFRIEYIAVPVTAILILALINTLFPGVLHKTAMRILHTFSAVFIVLFLFADTIFMSQAMYICYAVYAIGSIYVIIRFLMKIKLRSIHRGQGVFLISITFYLIITLNSILTYATSIRLSSAIPTQSNALIYFALLEAVAIFITVMKEVEDAKQAETRLAEEKAAAEQVARARAEMVDILSHEVRTPLTVMSTYAQLAVKKIRAGNADEQTLSDLVTISEEAKRLSVMASNTLRLSRMVGTADDTTEVENGLVNIGAVVVQLVGLFEPTARRANRRLNAVISEKLPPVWGDSDALTRLLWNLLDNAFTHSEYGDVEVRAEVENDTVRVVVRDEGIGIPPELLPKVFERGVSGKKDGTGLGLTFCREIARRHGGDISIESEYEISAAVTVTLPTHKEEVNKNE